MYARLYDTIPNQALTDDTKYPCPSLPIPGPAFSMYEEPVIHNREYYEAPTPPPSRPSPVLPQSQPPQRTPLTTLFPLATSSNLSPPPPSPSFVPIGNGELLPVLDCRFNLREVCKQCILLEDHLSHDKKRCVDCCIKHFLALEGLCEEAVTLDKKGDFHHLRNLAEKIREIQKLWYQDPDQNAHLCSQKLREIRKEFMTDVFPMIFEASNSCGEGMCTFRPSSK